jgi:hypothetical protein
MMQLLGAVETLLVLFEVTNILILPVLRPRTLNALRAEEIVLLRTRWVVLRGLNVMAEALIL